MEIKEEHIKDVLTAIAGNYVEELLKTQESDLEERWLFKWDTNASIEWNTYQFADLLELYKRSCRRWEEHHNKNCCVVERVRDKYVMPKVREFLAELAKYSA